MGELQRDEADRLSKRLSEKKEFLKTEELERYDNDTQTDHNSRTEDFFIKIERYFNQRERMSVEPVILENIDIEASTPKLKDYGHINGYIYRIFEFVEGISLSNEQEEGFEDLNHNEQVKRIKQIGKALAEVHESKAFEGYGNIETLDGEIIGASSSEWSEGLKDIQYFWHHYVGGEPFEEIKEDVENYYSEKEHVLNEVEESVLIHQELGFHNLLFQENSVTVVDWESAGAGDPLLDVIITEVILFWFQDLEDDLREQFRESYQSVRKIEFDDELIEVYRVVQLSRLMMIFDDNEEKLEKIKEEVKRIIE
jgi:aminoglycoside phosphotransferase (APT) family kinase protein